MARPATPGALMLIGGIGLGYWALFGGERSLFSSQRRSGTGVEYDPGTGTGTGTLTISYFKSIIGLKESGNNYRACAGESPQSYASCQSNGYRAYGKYQILPNNWSAWSKQYLGYVADPESVWAQEYIAEKKMQEYYDVLGDWRLVAAYWHGGPGSKDWGPKTFAYVNDVAKKLGMNTFPSLSELRRFLSLALGQGARD